MTQTIENLMSLEESSASSFELKVRKAQEDANSIRRQIEESGAELVHGRRMKFSDRLRQPEEDATLEAESLGLGYMALSLALNYLTQGKDKPLNETQYFELQRFVKQHLPRTMWDNELWCKRFNKTVKEEGIPVDPDVEHYMDENDRIFAEHVREQFN